jgi:hypothetical protein
MEHFEKAPRFKTANLEIEVNPMRKLLTALVAATTIAVAGVATPTTADARWRGWGGPALGGLVVGALIGSALARPYYGYPNYGYGYGPYYGNGYPVYYSYGYPPYCGYGDRTYFGCYGARY